MVPAEDGEGPRPPAGDDAAATFGAAAIVHLVGHITPPVMGFLLPTLHAMHAAGYRQALLYVSGDWHAEVALQVPHGVILVQVPDHRSPLRRSAALRAALEEFARRHPVSMLHLHGLLPGLAAVRWLRDDPRRAVDVYLSPHSSRAFGRPMLVRTIVGQLLRVGLGTNARHAIVNLVSEASLMSRFSGMPARLVENPVPQVFFDVVRNETPRPLVVSCNLEGQRAAVDRYARIAVLLNSDQLGISFNWVGAADSEAAAELRAAGVGQFEVSTDESRARRLATAWIYVAPTEERGFPVRLAEAMAAGLPCVALDTPSHRSLVVDGQTAFLCADLRGLLECIAALIDDAALRRRIGAAARSAVVARLSESVFRERLMQAMGATRPQAGDVPAIPAEASPVLAPIPTTEGHVA